MGKLDEYYTNGNSYSFDKHYMEEAYRESLKSEDPNTKVGAIVVKSLFGSLHELRGFNRPISKIDNNNMKWNREGKAIDTKYPYVVHAEESIVISHHRDLLNKSTIYTTLFPCSKCAKMIADSGIIEVVYLDDKYSGTEDNLIAKEIFRICGVKVRKFIKR